MGKRRNRRGKKRKSKRLTEDGFTNQAADVAIRKLQAQQEDTQANMQLERDITANPDVQAADSLVELFVSNVDDTSPEAFALRQLQKYFTDAKQSGNPGHSDILRLRLQQTSADEAVISFRKLRQFRDTSGKMRCRGCAIVEVSTDAVADFFCAASNPDQKRLLRSLQSLQLLAPVRCINCAPPGRHVRCLNIRRNGRRRNDQAASDATRRTLAVGHVSVVDIDFREVAQLPARVPGGHGAPQYYGRRLWHTPVTSAGINLKTRSIELVENAVKLVSLAVELRTVKHVKVLEIDGAWCLALRLRRPPTLDKCQPSEPYSIFDIFSGGAEAFVRGTDNSDCGAFASPTAYLCLSCTSSAGFTAAEKALTQFKLRFHKEALKVGTSGSRHAAVCQGISHRLPPTLNPLTAQDLADAGDTDYEISFLLDLLLRHGHLRAADVPAVLGMLRCLRAWGVIDSYQEYLQAAAAELPAVHRCNDGAAVMNWVAGLYERGCRLRQQDSKREWSTQLLHPGEAAAAQPDLPPGDAASQPIAQQCSPVKQDSHLHGSSQAGSAGGTPEEDDESEEEPPGEEEEGVMYPRRALVTPLRALLYPGAPEVSNRIIRRYSDVEDRFLRVSFASERLGSTSHVDLSDAVCERIRSLLLEGLTVGNRRFVFLAFSNSQLREHSCWLYCEDDRAADGAPSANTIRQSVGELHALRTPAKFAARLGQGFSTTFETFQFGRGDICEIPDVVARNVNRDLFSDGVGVITREGMRKVVSKLPVRMRRKLTGALPSAIQIRLGGCKGMLALWDGVPEMRRGALVGIRPSMKKFESSDLAVEVCSLARPMPAAINRQLTMALLSLGIDSAVFMRKFRAHIRQLDHLLTGGEEALTVLRVMGAYAVHSAKGVGVAQGSLPACMIEAGISPQDDLLLLAMCQAYRTFALKSVEDKCRMPLEHGINLIGVMDESGTLPEGTFWARWDRDRSRRHPGQSPADSHFKPLPPGTRTIVSRFPCLAPADVRVLRAADPSTLPRALTHLTNVIVFSQRGSPEPCKMAGGDLDGDIYLLTWDPALVPAREAEAVDYTPAEKPRDQTRRVSVGQIVDFFIDYMKNDQLGRIANGHLAIADFAVDALGERVYAENDKCHELVQLHSTAVDFAKTGIPVQPAQVTQVVKGEPVPDYLGGPDVSETVIGKITRAAKERIADAGEDVQVETEVAGRMLRHVDPQMLVPQRVVFRDDAEVVLDDWTYDVAYLMQKYGAEDVGQVFSGRVREFHGRAAGREKQADHQKQLDMELARLVEYYQRWWFPDMEPADVASTMGSEMMSHVARTGQGDKSAASTLEALESGTQEEMLCKASALYEAGYRPGRRMSIQEHLIRRACPWRVAPRLLLQLKLCMQSQQQQG